MFLTENGQLITTTLLFKLDDSVFQDDKDLLSLFEGAIGRSNKLSGISELKKGKIKFYNGNVYEFHQEERRRTFLSSRGKIETESEPREEFVKKQEYQWRIFMYEGLLDHPLYDKSLPFPVEDQKVYPQKYVFKPDSVEYRTFSNNMELLQQNINQFFDQGFSFNSDMIFSSPWGDGVYRNALGVKREGFLFKNRLLSRSFGLKQVKNGILNPNKDFPATALQKLAMQGRSNNMIYDILLDYDFYRNTRIDERPDIFDWLKLNPKPKVNYERLYEDLEKSNKVMRKDQEDLLDGELDYEYSWELNTYLKIRRSQVEIAKVEGLEFDFSKKLSSEDEARILTMVKENQMEQFKAVYECINKNDKEGQVLKLLQIQDKKKMNLLMIAGYYGHNRLFVELLTAYHRCVKAIKQKDKIGQTNTGQTKAKKTKIKQYLFTKD